MDQRNRGEELLSLSWKSSSTCSLPICSKASPAFLGCSLDALLQTVEHFVLIIMWSVCDALTDACAFSDKRYYWTVVSSLWALGNFCDIRELWRPE